MIFFAEKTTSSFTAINANFSNIPGGPMLLKNARYDIPLNLIITNNNSPSFFKSCIRPLYAMGFNNTDEPRNFLIEVGTLADSILTQIHNLITIGNHSAISLKTVTVTSMLTQTSFKYDNDLKFR